MFLPRSPRSLPSSSRGLFAPLSPRCCQQRFHELSCGPPRPLLRTSPPPPPSHWTFELPRFGVTGSRIRQLNSPEAALGTPLFSSFPPPSVLPLFPKPELCGSGLFPSAFPSLFLQRHRLDSQHAKPALDPPNFPSPSSLSPSLDLPPSSFVRAFLLRDSSVWALVN